MTKIAFNTNNTNVTAGYDLYSDIMDPNLADVSIEDDTSIACSLVRGKTQAISGSKNKIGLQQLKRQ